MSYFDPQKTFYRQKYYTNKGQIIQKKPVHYNGPVSDDDIKNSIRIINSIPINPFLAGTKLAMGTWNIVYTDKLETQGGFETSYTIIPTREVSNLKAGLLGGNPEIFNASTDQIDKIFFSFALTNILYRCASGVESRVKIKCQTGPNKTSNWQGPNAEYTVGLANVNPNGKFNAQWYSQGDIIFFFSYISN